LDEKRTKAGNSVQKDYYIFPRDGVYYAQFRDPVTREIQPRQSSGYRNRTLAEKWAADEWRTRAANCRKPDITFREYAAPFYRDEGCPHTRDAQAEGRRVGLRIRRMYRSYLNKRILPDPVAAMGLAYITRADALAFRDRLIASLGYTRKAALTLQAFKNIINTALDRGIIENDPVHRVTIKAAAKGTRPAVGPDDLKKLFAPANWDNPRLRLAALAGGLVGLRAGEIRGIKWRDIDAEGGLIHVDRSFTDLERDKLPKWEKTRTAPYPLTLKTQLEPLRAGPDDYVFAISKQGPLSYKALSGAMEAAVQKAAIPRITLHGLRHSIQTALLGAGVNPELLRASFGWVDADTQEGYTHRELFDLSPQRAATDALFGEAGPKARTRPKRRVYGRKRKAT
jgi:integrase